MIKPAHQKTCRITHQGKKYTFHNFRDFHRTKESVDQKQNRITKAIHIDDIIGLHMYISPFAFYNLVGHTFLSFELKHRQHICISIEGQQNVGENYSIWKAIRPGYRTRYIRGSSNDMLSLRTRTRKEKIYSYPIHISSEMIKNLFENLVTQTNKAKNRYQRYGIIHNNCTSILWGAAAQNMKISKRHFSFIFNKFLPNFLHKLGIIKLREKKEISVKK